MPLSLFAALRLPPVAMAVEVSVGYVRWVGVWARAWVGRAARGPSEKVLGFFFNLGTSHSRTLASSEQWPVRNALPPVSALRVSRAGLGER
jgi:hypothetical protein